MKHRAMPYVKDHKNASQKAQIPDHMWSHNSSLNYLAHPQLQENKTFTSLSQGVLEVSITCNIL